jgi:hypothetical protein
VAEIQQGRAKVFAGTHLKMQLKPV